MLEATAMKVWSEYRYLMEQGGATAASAKREFGAVEYLHFYVACSFTYKAEVDEVYLA
jgi:hypothetical protein